MAGSSHSTPAFPTKQSAASSGRLLCLCQLLLLPHCYSYHCCRRRSTAEVLALLLPADELEGFMELNPSMQEVAEIVSRLAGVTVGNLRASRPS
jgi:hypothetical protein